MPDLLCLGEPLFELSHIGGTEWREGIGGDVSNVAIAAARQGCSSGVVSRLGQDSFGDTIRAVWDSEGVNHDHVATDTKAQTGIYFIRQTNDGHQFEYRRSDSAASRLTPDDLPPQSPRLLHLSGITLAISASAEKTALDAIGRSVQNGQLVSYDPNLRLNLTSLEKARAAQCAVFETGCQIALPGLDDARQLTEQDSPEDIAAWYHSMGAQIVALTLGQDGALISTKDEMNHIPPRQVKAVDASGAGDCFDGCFLAQLLEGASPKDATAYATVAASISVQGYGAVTPIPHRKAVLEAQNS